MKDKMDRPENNELAADLNDSANQKSTSVDTTRRRLFGAGIAAPVILSMSSRTAWGGAMSAPSGCDSVTFSSHHPDEAAACIASAGNSPASWLSAGSQSAGSGGSTDPADAFFGGTMISMGDSFGDYFTSPPPSPLASYSTLQEVLDADATSIHSHAIAALLNAQTGLITLGESSPTTAVARVKDMFNAFLRNEGYTTAAGTLLYWNRAGDFYTMREYFTNYIDMPFSG